MFKGLGDIQNLMGQAKKMQEQMSQMQEDLAKKTVEANAGGGMVTVVANGKHQILSVKIDPSLMEESDVEMVEDLVTAGVNEALRRSQEMMTQEMSKLTGGMKLPGLL